MSQPHDHSPATSGPGLLAFPTKFNRILAAIRFEESLFALPIGYIGMLLAADGWPTWQQFLWINVAMTGARTLAMAANRLIHHKEDIANPRTQVAATSRKAPLPRGTCASSCCSPLASSSTPPPSSNTLSLVLGPCGRGHRGGLLLRQVLLLGRPTTPWAFADGLAPCGGMDRH